MKNHEDSILWAVVLLAMGAMLFMISGCALHVHVHTPDPRTYFDEPLECEPRDEGERLGAG